MRATYFLYLGPVSSESPFNQCAVAGKRAGYDDLFRAPVLARAAQVDAAFE